MSNIAVLTSMTSLQNSFEHTDCSAFPDDTAWFDLFEKHVLSGHEQLQLYYATAPSGDGSMLFPLISRKRRFGAMVLEALQNYYSVDYRPVCSSDSARTLIPQVISDIVQKKAVDAVVLKPMDAQAPETTIIKDVFKEASWMVHQKNCQANWVHDISGTYVDYLQTRPKKLRNTINRKSKRLLTMPNVELTIHDGSVNLDQIISDYIAVYDKSWKVQEPHPLFIPELIKALAIRGQIRLGLLKMDGIPIAVHFWIVKHHRAYIYKLAHDAAYDRYSPGTVLMAEMIKNAIDKDLVKTLDFLSGDDKYKKDWMDERRFKLEIIAYNPRSVKGIMLCLLNQYVQPLYRNLYQKLFRNFSKTKSNCA